MKQQMEAGQCVVDDEWVERRRTSVGPFEEETRGPVKKTGDVIEHSNIPMDPKL